MTSDQKSSPPEPSEPSEPPGRSPPSRPPESQDESAAFEWIVESPGGAFHPHQIEVQDFASYGLIVDVRPCAAYDNDHVPGAVNLEPADVADSGSSGSNLVVAEESGTYGVVPVALADPVSALPPEDPILVYCGRGGLDSHPLAAMLRLHGRTVDVIAGGWASYRRWVQAGLQTLPRMVRFRVISSSLGGEATRVLQAMHEQGHQVLDISALANWRPGQATKRAQPAQAFFETLLVDALRHVDGRLPVWIPDLGLRAGSLVIPGALLHALSLAPMARVKAALPLRLKQWLDDEPRLASDAQTVLRRVAAMRPKPAPELMARWEQLAEQGLSEALLTSVLCDCVEVSHLEQSASLHEGSHHLPPLVIESFEPEALAQSVRCWMPAPE